jgi:hypothetical protein
MPLLDIQRRGREVGRIRLGITVEATTRNGKKIRRPEKLSAFRLTTHSEHVARCVAQLLGGTARPWEGQTGQWEVVTECTELSVAVPPGDAAVSQWYEMWSGGGCVRRCDGVTEQTRQIPCLCPPAGPDRATAAARGEACKPTTRVNVIIPDLPDLGVWRVESHGFYAAVELGGAAELLASARAQGVIVPAVLRLEPREVKRITRDRDTGEEGQQTRRFFVPVLEVRATLRQMTALEPGGLVAALPPEQTGAKAISAGPAATTAPAAPATPPAPGWGRWESAQACAVAAEHVTELARLQDIGKYAYDRGWLEEHIEPKDPGGAWDTLRGVLDDRKAELAGSR